MKLLRQGGHLPGLQEKTAGRSSRLDEIQAAVLSVKLRHLNRWNLRRRDIARQYDEALRNITGLAIPFARKSSDHVYHLYVIQHLMRDQLRAHLERNGIETQIHYPFLLHQQPLFRHKATRNLPVAEEVGSRILSLPLYPQLTDNEVQRVIALTGKPWSATFRVQDLACLQRFAGNADSRKPCRKACPRVFQIARLSSQSIRQNPVKPFQPGWQRFDV